MCSRKWLIVALVVCGLATACQDYNTNLSVQTASSVLTFLSPSSANVGSQGFTITANGQGFSTGALILWNGVPLTTTLVSSIQLTAPVPASDLTGTGTVQVAVEIPGSAQSPTQNVSTTVTTAVSNVMLFTISAALGTPPSITSLSPNSAPFCGNTTDFPLTVTGTGFTSDSVVNWNGALHKPTMVTPTQLTATILARETVVSNPAAVTVSNSAGTSNSLQFTISSNTPTLPRPTIALYAGNPNAVVPIPPSPNPTMAPAGNAALALEIDAGQSQNTSFSACSVVQWVAGSSTTSLPTLYTSTPNSATGSPAMLTTTIPASLLSKAGTANIQIFTPAPGGGTSQGTLPFTITPPTPPVISSLTAPGTTTSVTSTQSCSPTSVVLQVNGTNFLPTSVVNWNGSPRPTKYVQPPPPAMGQPAPPPYLTVVIPDTDTLAPTSGTATITASNGSAVSNTVNFSVVAPPSLPAPTPSGIAPSSAMAGSLSGFTLTVTGTNFQPCSKIQWNGSPIMATSYLNPTQMTAPIPAGDLMLPGTALVTVSTQAPSGCVPSTTIMCGGISTATAATTFTISGLSIGGVSVLNSSPPAASTPYCSPTGFTLDVTSVTGTTFTSDTVVNWNGSPRPTTFVSATELRAAITYADTAFPGSVSITVSNSVPASTSAAVSFSLTPPTSLPVPSINTLSPFKAAAGGPGFTLSVTGSGLLPCSAVQWNGSAQTTTTTFTSVNGLTKAIPATDISLPGMEQVTVNTPPPSGCMASMTVTCGGTSNSETFTVYMPVAGAVRSAATIQEVSSDGGGRAVPLLSLHLMSSDHRYAVHVLASTDGVTEIPGATQNIFVRDTCAGAPSGCVPSEKLVSIGVGGNLADGGSFSPSISADGRYVAFLSSARNLVNVDTNGVTDVFVRDTCAGAAASCTPSTQLVSAASDGTGANGPSTSATIDAPGRYITFESTATNLGSSSSSSSAPALFLRDTCAGANAACAPSTQPTQ